MFFMQTDDARHVCDWDPRAGLALSVGLVSEGSGAAELALWISCHLPLPGTQVMKQKYLALLCSLLLLQLPRGLTSLPDTELHRAARGPWAGSYARVPEVRLLGAERGHCWGAGTSEHSEVALKPLDETAVASAQPVRVKAHGEWERGPGTKPPRSRGPQPP